MNAWLLAACAVTAALIPCADMCLRGSAERRLVGLEMASLIITIAMVLFTVGFGRSIFIDMPLALAIMSFGGGLVFARFGEAPMNVHAILVNTLLISTVAACWIGVVGMLRMKEPIQALHYLALPASFGMIALTIAVFVETGLSSTSFKTLLIAVVLLAINSVVTHATGRAFRTRELGHWEPRDGDLIEFVNKQKAQS